MKKLILNTVMLYELLFLFFMFLKEVHVIQLGLISTDIITYSL